MTPEDALHFVQHKNFALLKPICYTYKFPD